MNTQAETSTQKAPTAEETANARHAETMNANRILWSEIQELKEMIAALMMGKASQPAAPIGGEICFTASKLVCSYDSEKEKTYYKIKGGDYMKHGVDIWPEILEDAGINPEEINIKKPPSVSHFVAICTMKENGQPKKVVNLQPREA